MRHLISIILTALSFNLYADTRSCAVFLANPILHTETSDTGSFIAYLSQLLDEKVIPLSYLQALADLEENKSIPNPFAKISVESAHSIHASTIQMYLEYAALDKKQINNWARNLLKQKEQAKKVRQDNEKETRTAYTEMKFNFVKGGSFLSAKGVYKAETKSLMNIDYDFEMMSTVVTVKMWFDIMGDLPKKIKEKSLENGILLSSQYDMPITHVSWWSMLVFANRLSKNNNLQPVYDLSGIVFEGKPEDGTFKPITTDKRNSYDTFITKFKEKNILLDPKEASSETSIAAFSREYGYRLPTHYEEEFVRTDRGRSQGSYFTGIDEKNISEVAWYRKNAYGSVHPVAQLKALIIDDQLFYDLFGNVYEYTTNCYFTPKNLDKTDKDICLFHCYASAGGDYGSKVEDMTTTSMIGGMGDTGMSFSFRLVRSLQK